MDKYIDLDCYIMSRVLNLAGLGEGYIHREPLSGAVIAKDGRMIGAGFKNGSGGVQAELLALSSARESTRDASLYLNMEPDYQNIDSSFLSNKIVELGIKRIVIALENPNTGSGGKWAAYFQDKGIEIKWNVLKDEAEKINEIYLKYARTGMPYVILKTAVGDDGGVPKSIGENQWITEAAVRELIIRTRKRVMAVMTGIGTILSDDPVLLSQAPKEFSTKPIIILLDSLLRLPSSAAVFKAAQKHNLIIACTEKADIKKKKILESKGAVVIMTPELEGMVDLPYLLKSLGNMGIDSLLVEGGCRVSYSVLTKGIADKVLCFTAPKMLQGESRMEAFGGSCGKNDYRAALELQDIKCLKAGRSLLIQGYSKKNKLTNA